MMASSFRNRHVLLASAGIALGTIAAIALGFLALSDNDHPLTSLPFVALVALPVALAAIGLGRPPALLAAGIVSFPLAFLSLAGATLPAAFYLVAYGRAPVDRARVPIVLIVLLVIAGGAASFFMTTLGAETLCTKTIVDRGGKRFERPIGERNAHRLGPLKGGDSRVVETSCTEGPTSWNAGASLALLICTGTLIAWLSKPKETSISLR